MTEANNQKDSNAIYADQLAELLGKAQSGEWAGLPKVRGWRFDVSYGRSVSLSIVDNKLGSVYGPATARDSLGGGLYLIWEDERRSNASVDRLTIPEFEQRLREWYASSYADERAPDIRQPDPSYPEVPMYDPAIEPLVHGDTDLLFKIMKSGYDELVDKGGVEFLDAGASASSGTRYLRNSRGLDVSYSSTFFSYSFYADSLYGNGYGKRRIAPEEELPRIINDVRTVTALLKQNSTFKSNPAGNRVLLDTGLAGSFIGQYIGGNLSGSGVANRQAAYSLDDFREHKKVIRDDISLVIDGTRAFESSASRLTGEGIPGGRGYLIEKGKLITPALDLKYAGITGFEPTPAGGLYIELDEGENKQSFEQMIKNIDYGLLVYSVLGMHTQDSTSGRFSLSAPHCLVVENGELKGKVKATLSGNFFDNINDPNSRFGWDPYEENPAMEINCQVVVEE
ncbi:MAG TPA: metallopeptidase TldD-related protein [Chloroflexia bacterium]|nr:metallopeptidase TldD-related protein [Chloroflexia bacterium]